MNFLSLNARRLAGAALLATLAACGGGGDAGTTPAAATEYPIRTAYHNLITTGGTWTTSGTGSDGVVYTFVITFTPQGTGTFPLTGATANKTQLTATISTPGRAPVTTQNTNYTRSDNDASVGTDNGDGTCSQPVAGTAIVLPDSATAGAVGGSEQTLDYSSCTPGTSPTGSASSTDSWSLELDRGVPLLCQNTTVTDGNPPVTSSLGVCVEVTASGGIGNRARVTLNINQPAFTLQARNY